MTSTERLRYDISDGVATLTLDDPDARNALGDGMVDDLSAAFSEAKADEGVRVVVIASSHPRVFSAGGDLGGFRDERAPIEKYQGMERIPCLYRDIAALGKPVLCAANGDVLAGAFGLALACDLIVAKDSARFGCPEINVGAFPFMISALVFRNIGRMKANELMFLGDQISATEAERLGIVNHVTSDAHFDEVIATWARRLAEKSPLLMRMGKDAINATCDMHLSEALEHLRGQLALAFTTEDLREGVNAFFEKRTPEWAGR